MCTHVYILLWVCVGGELLYQMTSWSLVPPHLILSLWIRGTKSWGTGMWAEGSLTSLVHIFLMVPRTSQVSLVWPWDDLEKSLSYSIAARWRARMRGWLVRWRAGLAKPSRIICRPDWGTGRHAAAPSYALPGGSDAVPGSPSYDTVDVWGAPLRELGPDSHPSCSEPMFVFQYVFPARRPTRGS